MIVQYLVIALALAAATGPALAEQAIETDNDRASSPTAVDAPEDNGTAQMDTDTAQRLAILNDTVDEQRRKGATVPALEAAREIAVIIEDQYGAGPQLVEPLRTIAELELELAEPSAEQTLGQLIRLIEFDYGIFSADLIEPITMLAALYSESGRKEEAITMLRRARHISHRELGILNLEQIDLAQHLADAYFQMGKIAEGSRENRFAYRINVNEYGEDSAELAPALNTLAAWYERIGEFTLARQYYKRSIDLIEKDYGENDLRLVDALQRLAATYRKQRIYKGDGKRALIRAVNIHENHVEGDEVAYANTLAELGDWFMSTGKTRDAIDLYRRAWNVLTIDGASPERGDLLFGQPKRLRFEPPIPPENRMSYETEVYVDVELIVTAEGAVREVSVINATADWRLQNEVRMAMRHARFRPRFVDGEPVAVRISSRWTYTVPLHLRRSKSVSTAGAE